ncbi:MAG TPA: MbnP family protein [Verrucomicrobiae bacterium]|jgi:cytochrome c peroxidase|nr:MbnP family protein [Verrucomicrobiae bacterium]
MMRPLAVWILSTALSAASGASLQIEVTPKSGGEDIQFASLRYKTAAGERFSITRISYLASNFALQRTDDSWLEFPNVVAWLDAAQNRNSLRLQNVPPGEYRSIRFTIGLDSKMNHANPAKFPANDPLNPNLNGLHWNWQGGYIFLALEGLWRNDAGQLDGWSYHLARDGNNVPLTLAVPLEITNETKLEIDFDIAALLNSPQPLSFARDGSSTHSRDGDPILAALKANLPEAFRVRRIHTVTETELAAANPKPLYLPKKYTPYPFQMSATFPMPALPRDNPLIEERVALGQKLFHETALSKDRTISCASCHHEKSAYSDPRPLSLGVEGRLGVRHAMPLFNLAWRKSYFWDGRAPSLRAQALMPIQNHAEMDETLTNVVTRLTANTSYPSAFRAAFGSPEITPEKIGLALEQFLLSLTSFDSKFDRVLRNAEKFTPQEQRGFQLFSTEYDPRRGQFGADCFHCHGGALFQSQTFANNGLDANFPDIGRAKVTGKKSDEGKFAVPSLRNVALTGPYMHDGRFKTLEEAVAHYCSGVKRSATLDPNLAKHPNGGVPLSKSDQGAIVAFLKTLTDPRFLQ